MTAEREARIREYRLRQPITELQRKADKSRDRARLWTQEELDASEVEAAELCRFLNGD